MATAPQIALRDGSGFTTNLVFTTNEDAITITGTVDVNTSVIQVSINGSPFVTDPTLISFVLQTFTIPNPVNYPSGLPLNLGLNTIQIRTIDIVGGVSPISTVSVTRVAAISETTAQIPTGIRVVRHIDSIDILAAKPVPLTNSSGIPIPQPTFIGFNYYASANPGGAVTGYHKVNQSPVSAATQFQEDVLGTITDTVTWDEQFHKNVRIRVTDLDEFGNELAVKLDSIHNISPLTGRFRFTSTVENFQLNNFVLFNFSRAGGTNIINTDLFANVQANDPLYFVVTGIYFDPLTNTEIETPYSQEILGTPLTIDTSIRDLPGRNQTQVVTDYVQAVQRVNNQISLIPGSISRDVDIDPFSSEAERIWFLLDFVHRSQSFLTLLPIDNVSGNGVSDSVAGSAYKQALKAALGLTSDDAVQSLIDQQFDKLSANVQKTRLPGRPAVGQVVIYTETAPTQDIIIPAGTIVTSDADPVTGTPAIRFVIGGSFVLSAANAQAFFNFNTKRYEIVADITAQQVGVAGNLPAGSIKNILGVSGVSVTNTSATVFGDDQETNHDLAERSILAFSSVDTGTEGGYASTAASQIGVIKAKIVKSGDALMMRDYDDLRHKHIGGKVDIWVQGIQERQVTDTFAFTFEIALGIQCQIIDLTNLIFRVLDSRVTPNTPIIEILNNIPQNLGVHNVTTGLDYDLTGVAILDYQTFQINTGIAQPLTHIDDIITADYRFRVVNQFHFTLQPVRRVVSVVGEVAGPLDPNNNYKLFKTDDPLLTGESTIANDYLTLTQFAGKPSGNTIPVNNETHVMIGFQADPLNSIGINTLTIRVFNAARTIEYDGPGSPAPDYNIIAGTPTTPASIVRTASSTIPSGATVSVDYVKDENFTVTYVINDLLQQLQQVVNSKRHVTADVLVKQAIQNFVNISTTVQLSAGAAKDVVDPNMRSAVSLELNRKIIGESVAQSNVDAAITDTAGVSFNVLPMALMAYADGSQKLRETVSSSFAHVGSLDIGGNRVFILTSGLEFPTTDGGGVSTEHKGVFMDDVGLTMATSMSTVGSAANQGWIIGSGGATISGYSDDATLLAQGVPADQLAATRLKLTANHVLVSLTGAGIPQDDPSKHAFAVSYIIRGDSGSHDILAAEVEFIDLGDFVITYRNASGS
jgi:hypothetical protein